MIFAVSCSKNKDEEAIDGVFFKDVPSVFTLREVQGIGFSTATLQGSIKNNGSSQREDFGFCYATSPSPTVNNTKISPSVVVFKFQDNNELQTVINNLLPNTRYYVRGYITSNGKTTYTREVSFQTLLPFTVSTSELKVLNSKTASAKGTVLNIAINGTKIVTYGMVVGNSQNPTIQANLFISQQTGQNLSRDFSFSSTFNDLQADKNYHLRAFAVDASGYTSYGENLSFVTPQETRVIALSGDLNFGNVIVGQTVQRTLIISNTGTTALTINSLAFSSVAFSGNVSITIAPNSSQNITISFTPTAAGNFSGTITVNANQTSGINTINFSGIGVVPVILPSVQTINVVDITQNSATLNGNLSNLGNADNTQVAFVYSSSNANPTLSSLQTFQQNFNSPNAFNAALTGLASNTTYYFRAYATNTTGTVYGAVQSFRTGANTVQPSVQTVEIANIGQTTANVTGRLTSLGTFSGTLVAFLVSTSQNPDLNNSVRYNSGIANHLNNFGGTFVNLSPNTTYYFRAIAETSVVTLGNVLSFKTLPIPTVPTEVRTVSAVVSPTNSSLYTLTGEVASMGTATSVDVGFEISINGGQTFIQTFSVGTRTSVGTFTFLINGLQNGTTYHFRAYGIVGTVKTVGATKLLR